MALPADDLVPECRPAQSLFFSEETPQALLWSHVGCPETAPRLHHHRFYIAAQWMSISLHILRTPDGFRRFAAADMILCRRWVCSWQDSLQVHCAQCPEGWKDHCQPASLLQAGGVARCQDMLQTRRYQVQMQSESLNTRWEQERLVSPS